MPRNSPWKQFYMCQFRKYILDSFWVFFFKIWPNLPEHYLWRGKALHRRVMQALYAGRLLVVNLRILWYIQFTYMGSVRQHDLHDGALLSMPMESMGMCGLSCLYLSVSKLWKSCLTRTLNTEDFWKFIGNSTLGISKWIWFRHINICG